jgi:hypothetical protein
MSLHRASDSTPPSRWGFQIVRFVLGGFLLVAAGLKAHGLALDPFTEGSVLASARLQVATIEIEIVLGLWLLSGWSILGAWTSALIFFLRPCGRKPVPGARRGTILELFRPARG